MRRLLLSLAVLVLVAAPTLACAQARLPLLLPGKKTLYQRVLTHPGAKLLKAPKPDAEVAQDAVKPFSVLYVYTVTPGADGRPAWYEVGAGSNGRTEGWLAADAASAWTQSLTLVFTPRTGGRQPVLFFRDKATLAKLVESADPAAAVAKYAAALDQAKRAGKAGDDAVVAREPADLAVAAERFYMLPIFGTTDTQSAGGIPVKLLEVASIDPGSGTPGAAPTTAAPVGDARQYRTAIAFVIDTTKSMQPYIDRTGAAIRQLYGQVQKAGQLKNVSFAVVGFRNSTEKTPGLGYVTKVFANLDDGRDPAKLMALIKAAKATEVSSHSFDEDAFAGLDTAINDLDWRGYGARIIFFVTDAGALRKDDPAGRTHMNESQIALAAADKQIKIFAFHLLSAAGARAHDHESAAAQYRTLTRQDDASVGDLYLPIANADPDRFRTEVETVGGRLVDVIRATAAGRRLPPPSAAKTDNDPAARKAAALGYALQLEFLGRQQAAAAPHVVTAYVADRDIAHPASAAFDVCVLLTRQQLSNLHDALNTLLAEAQRAKRTGSTDFFQRVASAAATMSNDPDQVNHGQFRNLAETGLFGEYLSGLPYKSDVLNLTQDDWSAMSIGEQQAFIDDIEAKMNLYVQYDEHSDSWESFGARNPNDAVFRVPLAALP